MVSTVWSVFVCCSSTHGAPRVQPFVKVGARAPRVLWSRRHGPLLFAELAVFPSGGRYRRPAVLIEGMVRLSGPEWPG